MKTLANARLPEEPSCAYCRLGAADLCRCQKAAPPVVGDDGLAHDSDCATHNEPAYPNGACDCFVNEGVEK